jgi:hypothetical protein
MPKVNRKITLNGKILAESNSPNGNGNGHHSRLSDRLHAIMASSRSNGEGENKATDNESEQRRVKRFEKVGKVGKLHSPSEKNPSIDSSTIDSSTEKEGIPPFPIEVFPSTLRLFLESISKALPCPVDFPSVLCLPVLGSCIGRKRSISPKEGWKEYPLLWAAVMAESGERKTPALKEVSEPLRFKQKTLKQELAKDIAERKRKPLKDRGKPPHPKQTFTTDATVEALKEVLEANPDGICYLADELSGWIRSMGQYKGGRGDDRQHWLSIHSGWTTVCNRVGKPPIVLTDPFIAVSGGIQPGRIGDVLDDRQDDGGPARILLSYPSPIENTDWTEDSVQHTVKYKKICDYLWDLPAVDTPMTLSNEAKDAWIEWVNVHRKEEVQRNLKAVWSKAEGHCLRLALILYLVSQACNEPTDCNIGMIDRKSVSGAIRLIDYFKKHAKKVYKHAEYQNDDTEIGKVLRWMDKRGLEEVTVNKLIQYRVVKGSGRESASQAALRLFKDLEQLGHGELESGARGSHLFRLRRDSGKISPDSGSMGR